MAIEIDKLYKLSEVAKIIGVTSKTISAWAREGRIPAVKMGREWRLAGKAVIDLMEHGQPAETSAHYILFTGIYNCTCTATDEKTQSQRRRHAKKRSTANATYIHD